MMTKDKKEELTLAEVHTAVKDLREEIEKKDADPDKIEKLQEALDNFETKNQEFVIEQEAFKKEAAETAERLVHVEKLLSRPKNGAGSDEQSPEIKALRSFIMRGEDKITADEVKYLRSDNEADGGVLAPAEFLREIIKAITEISPIRSIARVRTVGAGKMEIPVRNTLVSAEWEGEGETGTDSNSKYGVEKIPLSKLTVTVPITIEELADSAFDMEAEINADIIESFNQKEGTAFVKGTGSKQPEGYLTNAALKTAARVTTNATALTFDSILLLAGDLKTGYNPVYTMNRKTIANIRTLKDGVGQYLWQVGNIAAGIPNQINGFPYIETPDMDDIAAAAFPIAFGDFRMGYLIGDSLRMDVIRDPFTLKKAGKVEFTFTRRVGAQVVNAEAIRLLKVSV